MTKSEYAAEMLTEALYVEGVEMLPTIVYAIAKDIVDGLDMWHEMSGDSVASSNRYQELEGQIEQAKKAKQEALDRQEREYNEKLKDANASARAIISQKNMVIEELQKQIP